MGGWVRSSGADIPNMYISQPGSYSYYTYNLHMYVLIHLISYIIRSGRLADVIIRSSIFVGLLEKLSLSQKSFFIDLPAPLFPAHLSYLLSQFKSSPSSSSFDNPSFNPFTALENTFKKLNSKVVSMFGTRHHQSLFEPREADNIAQDV